MREGTRDAIGWLGGLLLAAAILWAGWMLIHALPLLVVLAVAGVGLHLIGAWCAVRLICALLG